MMVHSLLNHIQGKSGIRWAQFALYHELNGCNQKERGDQQIESFFNNEKSY